ncbi:DUF4190 domain-containing protein [Alloscardovia omnicolens]|uniref:DUF4190 domain-containing protein n=1 Tax=Alloscardovia omnicolens TaxID=419015 RepID=UPI003A5FE84D
MTDDVNKLNNEPTHDAETDHCDGPAYGRLASEFPGWDPYVYGKPRESEDNKEPVKNKRIIVTSPFAASSPQRGADQQNHRGTPNNASDQPQFFDRNGNPIANPFEQFEFDPDDPQKNPVYGRWDFYAIIAFIGSFFTQTTLLALFLAIMSLNRTKKLHMKGRALAIIALVLCVLQIVLFAYIVANGMTEMEFLNMVMAWIQSHIGA